MADRVTIDAAFVVAKIDQLKRDFPELEDDFTLLADTVEGQTDFERVLSEVVEEKIEADATAAGAGEFASKLSQRKQRAERKSDLMRGLALDLMTAARQHKVKLPIATLSILAGRPGVVIDDVLALPQGFTRPEAIKSAIKQSIENGESVPGAHLEAGPDTVSIRTI
jgi:hypothetical protein